MATTRTVFHVIPYIGRKWWVKASGNGRGHLADPVETADTKEQAVELGRRLARRNRPSQLVIHHAPGEIETEEPTHADR